MMEKLSNNTNALNWFEIAVLDMARAQAFYESIFQIKMIPYPMPPEQNMEMVMFSDTSESGKVSGALVKSPNHKPSMEGTYLYMNANPSLQAVLDRVVSAGGSIMMPATDIGDGMGFMAFIIDTEGNAMGLHAGNA